jgi:glycosyltransferase involved in cell wall biosynthesis
MTLAYLTNVYPAPSHTFIRREILAHEAADRPVLRYAIRRHNGDLADPRDREELGRTGVVLDAGAPGLLVAFLRQALGRPVRCARALRAAVALGRRGNRGILLHLVYLAEASLLRERLLARGVEHVHVHFGTNPAAVALLCRILGGPSYSFTVHGPDEFDSAASLGLDLKARGAAFVVAISSYGRSQLCRWIASADHAKLQIVHCGLDRSFLDTPPAPVPDVQRLVFVGRLTTTKGIFVLLDALVMLGRRGIRPTLAIIGGGPEQSAVEARVHRDGLQDRVEMLGWQGSEEVRQQILGSRALVLPSFAEGLPVVLMESLALGRPVVATWVAGIPELVEPGKSGWLVPPGSVESLAEAIEQVLRAPVERLTELGMRGRETVLREHDAATEAAKLATLFQGAVEANERS